MRLLPFAAGIAALCLSAPAAAEDTKPCGAGLICASDPQTVMAALEKAGLKPRLSKDGEGDPMIESDESSYHFDVYFYGCAEHKNCDSLRFETLFEKAPENTPALADKWNSKKRFLQASVRNDQQFAVAYDLATIGGLNAANFTDVIDWWNSQLNELATFFKEEIPEKKAEPKS
ncbi:YbjN domain-containing protein [Sphingomonas sp. DG1-23]|uniref:YbjN domain-containing protein n=1 Tax=Sphingomonas sp. DG1-23 TaxID=3068316 RepID=UPI00273FCA48|nr:YbjN domain-containing protein [Sphingomonas sp. DG1-23]MDP5278619.1 YbjN domain-containing protein [Sphingomonas sp. DG1-23]